MKIRNLLSDPVQSEVCLDELVKTLVATSKFLVQLEEKNTGDALRNAKRSIAEFKKKFIEFEQRIKGPITNEVLVALSRRDKSIRIGNPDRLDEYRNKKKNK